MQDTSEWFSVVEQPPKEHPAVSFSQIMRRAGIFLPATPYPAARPSAFKQPNPDVMTIAKIAIAPITSTSVTPTSRFSEKVIGWKIP
ncbi:MAG: hypothetical protein ACI9A1_001590 [Lentimonas sp.]